jgi:predicted GIY-YIG superfamily endonuclease
MEKRLVEHELNHYPCYTSTRLPVELVFIDTCGTRYEALSAERRIKSWSRVKKEAFIKGDYELLREKAKRKTERIRI